jgi:hypothetical protein
MGISFIYSKIFLLSYGTSMPATTAPNILFIIALPPSTPHLTAERTFPLYLPFLSPVILINLALKGRKEVFTNITSIFIRAS